jgi:hypothetical protein
MLSRRGRRRGGGGRMYKCDSEREKRGSERGRVRVSRDVRVGC